jgi:hypothetical protein
MDTVEKKTTNTSMSMGVKIIGVIIVIAIIVLIVVFTLKNKKKFAVETPLLTTTSTVGNVTTPIEEIRSQTQELKLNDIATKFILPNYTEPLLKNIETNQVIQGKFVILDESSDIIQELSANIVLSTMYFDVLQLYVIRCMRNESLQHCYIHSKTLENVCIPQDYSLEPELTKNIKPKKQNEPLQNVLKYDDSKKYYPPSLKPLIEYGQTSFLQRTTMNLNGVDSKRV